jgi:hypothetical protein
MDHVICCRFDSNSKNQSFFVKQNNEIVAIVPLVSQYCFSNRNINEFSNHSVPTPYWALKNNDVNINRHNIIKFIQNEINNIASSENVGKRFFFIDPLIDNNYLENFEYYNLLKYDYDYDYVLKMTNILDLGFPLDMVLSKMRNDHRCDIKRALKDSDMRIDCIDCMSRNIDDLMMEFKDIHIIDAGRQTRTDASWSHMSDWIKDDFALLMLAWSYSLKKHIGGAFVIKYKNKAYYASYAAIDTSLNNAAIGPLLQWSIIKHLKDRGIKYYETGWNYYLSSFESGECNKKLLSISEFKRGFGGKEKILLEYVMLPSINIKISEIGCGTCANL